MPSPSTVNLLKEIQSSEIETVYIHVTNKAVEWAVAGFIDTANRLLEKLWSFGTPHSGHLWVPDQGFIVMWRLSGKKPANVPFEEHDITQIEKINYDGLFLNEVMKELPPLQTADPDAIKNYLIGAGQRIDEHAHKVDIEERLEHYEKQLNSPGIGGYWYFQPATCGAILAARHGDIKKAEHFITLWGKGYADNWANYTPAYLMRDTATAKILLTGILAPVFGITTATCKQEYDAIAQALDSRYATGRTLVYDNLTWKELLKKISVLAIQQQSNDFDEEMLEAGWLGMQPAGKEDIEAAEKSLGIQLPEDYKQFLLISNGFASISSTDVFLAQVEDIQWFRDFNPSLVDGWSETHSEYDPAYNTPFKNSIIIGGMHDEQQLLLVPVDNGVWECWFFAFWIPGEDKFPSLRYYMEERLQRLEEGFYAG
ncbi:MAG TPA: SMI1/KNR4 family protein [Chitinophagaceae bacterium]|nr:SMI1/KNR4 family protein [Chitinophagaceae bacterium]